LIGLAHLSRGQQAYEYWTSGRISTAPPKRVAGTFGTDGKRVTMAEFSEVRRYPRCGGGTSVIVNYERKAAGKPLGLTSKYW